MLEHPLRNPCDIPELMRLSTQAVLMTFEAQMIIAMRVGGMAGYWNVTKGENSLMSREKLPALHAASAAAMTAMMLGATPAGIALAAIAPVRSKTTANMRRLGKRGLKLP